MTTVLLVGGPLAGYREVSAYNAGSAVIQFSSPSILRGVNRHAHPACPILHYVRLVKFDPVTERKTTCWVYRA